HRRLRHAWMNAREHQLVRHRIRLEDAEIRNHRRRSTAAQAEAAPRVSALAVTHRRDEVKTLDEALGRLAGDDDHLSARRRDLRRPARARESNLRRRIRRADHRRVDVREAVELRDPEEADVDPAGLYPVVEDLDQAHDGIGRLGQNPVADREWEVAGLRADRPGLVDEY